MNEKTLDRQNIYFVSDVHLGALFDNKKREKRFLAWLDTVAADAKTICLNGDIFDVWLMFEGKKPAKSSKRVLDKFKELTGRGIRMIILAGNHDPWLGNYFVRECGMEEYSQYIFLEEHGKRIFVAHGDYLELGGKVYGRKMFRRAWVKKLGERLPGWINRGMGHIASIFSSIGHTFAQEKSPELLTASLICFVRDNGQLSNVDYCVFGHTHKPYNSSVGTLRTVHLGGWEKHPSYAVLDDRGELTLKMLDE